VSGIPVLHAVGTLDLGGAERVAVGLANAWARAGQASHLCSTRREGPLAKEVDGAVGRLRLDRRARLDPRAVLRLRSYLVRHDVLVLHAHGPAVYLSWLASWLPPGVPVVWHAHHGALAGGPATRALRVVCRRVAAVVAVTPELARWAQETLPLAGREVLFLPNFVEPAAEGGTVEELPGEPDRRIVCVANVREEKDPLNVIRAMARVAAQEPRWTLLLVGGVVDSALSTELDAEIVKLGLGGHVARLGLRQDVPALLRSSRIGVLPSSAEGFPLVLLEYGAAGLPVVCTDTGACAEILDGGEAGILVPPRDPDRIAEELLGLIRSEERRRQLGRRLRQRVESEYGPRRAVGSLMSLYERVLAGG
jgi:glycosyltransferase involved in cell wall biosynthesis